MIVVLVLAALAALSALMEHWKLRAVLYFLAHKNIQFTEVDMEVPAPGAGTPIQTVGGLSNIDDKTLVATDERTFREAEANLEAIFFVFLHTLSSRMLSSRS